MKRRSFPEGTVERVTVATRTTAKVRARLEEAAAKSDRSLSQEMERRLAESFVADDIILHAFNVAKEREAPIVDMLGGPETFSVLRDIAWLISGIQGKNEAPWHKDPELTAQAFKAISFALGDILRTPRGDGLSEDELSRSVRLSKFLPERPVVDLPKLPESARFMSDEELKQMFYRNDDNE